MNRNMETLHPLGNTLLRTPETFARYHDNPARAVDNTKKNCFICAAPPIRIFPYWKVIPNDFPYDAVSSEHVLLVPLRHTPNDVCLSAEEFAALDIIRRVLNKEGVYDAVVENLARGRTVPGHFHYHLIQWLRA